MPLSEEEKRRIREEEAYRAEARVRAEAETEAKHAQEKKAEERKKTQQGCLGCLGLIALLALVVYFTDRNQKSENSPVATKTIKANQLRVTELSKSAAGLRLRMNRSEVLSRLGQPTWVLLQGDNSDFAPKKGNEATVKLIWKNGLCASVVADFNQKGQLIGWDEGRGGCSQSEEEAAAFNPPEGQFSCAEANRAMYCSATQTQSESRSNAPPTATEIAAARKALCQAMSESSGKGDLGIPRANQIYQAVTGEDFDRTLEVVGPQFSGLMLHEWSCR
jgi:hypothetical protein